MTDVTVNRTIAPNVERLHEELDAHAFGIYSLQPPSAYPGDIIAKYEVTLSGPDQTTVTNTITNHNETETVASQDRDAQDVVDLDAISADFTEDPTTWTMPADDAKVLALLKRLARCMCRTARNEEI